MSGEHPVLELVLDPIRPNPDNLAAAGLLMSDYGSGARVYLGRVLLGRPDKNFLIAIKFQLPPAEEDSGEGGEQKNTLQLRDERWEREMSHYRAVGAQTGFTPLFFVSKAPERSGQPDRPQRWPALLYCHHRQLLFRPHGAWGGALETCRDAKLLAEFGLPEPSLALRGILYNRIDFERGHDLAFFELGTDNAVPLAGVKSFGDLLEEQARIPGMPGAEPASIEREESLLAFSRLTRDFACLTCPERAPCYAGKLFQQRLKPFLVEDTNALVLELNRFEFDEFCDLLGGISWRAFEKKYLGPEVQPAQKLRLGDLESLMGSSPRYLLETDASGMDAIEVFRLKWSLFGQVCQAVYDYHRLCGTAHLKLEPRHLMIQSGESGGLLPNLWQFQARLISLGSPTMRLKSGPDFIEEVLMPPLNTNPIYQSESITNSAFGILQSGAFILTGISAPDEGGGIVLRGELQHEGLGLSDLDNKDYIRISLRNVLGLGTFGFCGRFDAEARRAAGVLPIQSVPTRLEEKQLQGLRQILNKRHFNTGFVLYPALNTPADIYSLGMLLFRTLLVNDTVAMDEVALTLDRLRVQLSLPEAEKMLSRRSPAWPEMLERFDPADHRLFERTAIFYDASERVPERPNAIPQSIWERALLLGLRMITNTPDFSICAGRTDYNPHYPAARMEEVVQEVRKILIEIDTALFSRSTGNAELRAALDSVLGDITMADN